MGQEITVRAREGSSPNVRIFDCNRSLTGMAIERYTSVEETKGRRPPDVLAKRLFDLGATRLLGLIALEEGDHAQARICFERVLAEARERDFEHGIAMGLTYLGHVAQAVLPRSSSQRAAVAEAAGCIPVRWWATFSAAPGQPGVRNARMGTQLVRQQSLPPVSDRARGSGGEKWRRAGLAGAARIGQEHFMCRTDQPWLEIAFRRTHAA